MKNCFTLLLALCFVVSVSQAQERYTEEVYTDAQVKVTSDVQFATNATIFPLLFDPNVSEFVPEDLFMDVYEPDPSVDTLTDRPMVLVVHGGDALPRIINNACYGDKTDSVTVTTARKLARMGYVAVAPNYRLGWNPLATNGDDFLDGLVDASVRIQQDLRAAARYLRKDIAEDGNTFGIDTDRFTIWGTASSAGTYSGFTAYINEVEELQTPTFFVTDEDGNVRLTFDEDQAGNIEGTVVGMLPNGDTTNYINTPGYSSAFQIAALGSGIALDPGVVDPDEPAMIMFGNPNSPVTQFPEGPIQLPTTGQVVAFAQLSLGLIKEAVEVGVNDAWIATDFTDAISVAVAADTNFGAVEGWLPLYGDPDNEYPWVHWDTVNCSASATTFDVLPAMDTEYAISQIDTMAAYFGVRACVTFGLNCPSLNTTSIRDNLLADNVVTMAPNPTNGSLLLSTNRGQRMETVDIFNINGQLVQHHEVGSATFEKANMGLASGFYSVVVRLREGVSVKKLVITE